MQHLAVDYDPFAHGEILRVAPTTASQREIWVAVQMGADANCAFNESLSLWLQGDLDIHALYSALQALIERHEALRMTFNADGTLLCINETQDLSWTVTDLLNLPLEDQNTQLQALQHSAVSTPFDLKYGPLFRTHLVRLDPQTAVLLLTAHHLVCDGWSWGILIPDLGTLYSAYHRGAMPELPEVGQFSEYAIAETMAEDSPEAIATLQYWQQQFRDAIPVLNLPTDQPRPTVRTFSSDCIEGRIEGEQMKALKQFANQSGVSFLTLLLSGFEVFLHQLTGQPDLVVGLPFAGQAIADTSQVVGHGVHLLPLRTQIQAQDSFATYLQHRRTQLLDAYEYPALTFGRLIQHLHVPRDPSRVPLVAVTFNLDPGLNVGQFHFEGLTASYHVNPRAFGNFELSVNATEWRSHLQFEWQYNTDLFTAATIHQWMQRYTRLLFELVQNPQALIALQGSSSQRSSEFVPPLHVSTPHLELSPFPTDRHSFAASLTLEQQLIEYWEHLLHVHPIDPQDNFFTLGGNSMLAIQCFAWLEQQIGHKLPLTTLFQTPTIAGLIETIQNRGWFSDWSYLVPIQPKGSKPPLFCIHPHGGTVLCYRDLAQHLDPERPFYGIQAQGLDGKRPPLDSIEAMATAYLREIQALQPRGPYFLSGFCVGGYIAYEIAQQLQLSGESIGILIAIDTAPDLVTKPEFSEKDIGFYWQNLKERWQSAGVGDVIKSVGTSIARNLASTLSPELQEFDRMWQVHTRAVTRYKPQPYAGLLHLVLSEEWAVRHPDYPEQWQQWAASIQHSRVPGIHDKLLEPPMVLQVARQINQYLQERQNLD